MVKLNRPATFSDSIWPVCLPPAGEFYEGRSGYVTGEPEGKNKFVKRGLFKRRGDYSTKRNVRETNGEILNFKGK